MEYHYQDLCIPSELLTDHYNAEFTPQYIVPKQEAEYHSRSSILVDGGDRFGVSAVVFDKYEELVWMGNQGGHITSYYGPSLQKYTSFQVHDSEEIRDLLTVEQGIYALTKTTLRHQIRRGIPKYTYKSRKMVDMQCMYQVSPTKLLIGGHQNTLIDLDLNKLKETCISIEEDSCVLLRSGGGSLVACGSARGEVFLRDPRSPKSSVHKFRAHNACLSDLDMQGDLLITCGFGHDVNGASVAEPYVVVWDVRRLRAGRGPNEEAAWTIPTSTSGPQLLHFLPAFSGRAVAVCGDRTVALLNINAPTDQSAPPSFQVDTQNSLCSVMDVSSSSQALVFGDQGGHLHVYSPRHNHEPIFNGFSRDTEFADPVAGLPLVNMRDTEFQFSSIPLPALASGDKYFNYLPQGFFKKQYRKPKSIDPEVLKSMKMQGPIGYSPNPGTCRRNQMPYIEDTLDDLNSTIKIESQLINQPIPKHYQKLDIRYNKHGPNEELDECNKTGFPGLESTIPNSYCNSMLQVLYYTPSVKTTLLAHSCSKEFCLSCELGFLFRSLDAAEGATCQAGRFLRAFRTLPEAAALGLILPERERPPDLVALIQSWNRFILHQIHNEILETRKKEKALAMLSQNSSSPPKQFPTNAVNADSVAPQSNGQFEEEFRYTELEFLGPTEFDNGDDAIKESDVAWKNGQAEKQSHGLEEISGRSGDSEESDMSQLFAIGRRQKSRCLKCNKEEERSSVVLACALQFPSGGGSGGSRFSEALAGSLAARRSTPAWCEQCARFTPTALHTHVQRLPPILAINCGGVTAHEKAYWSKGIQKENDATKRGGSGKPCRYGLHCARPGCRFKHPDRPSPQTNSKSPTQESQCVLPHQLNIRLQGNGEVVINDPGHQLEKSVEKSPQVEEMYALSAAVVCVEDNPKNLVAYIDTAKGASEPAWYMFNDLSIMPVNSEEVMQFGAWWKSPCVLFYTSESLRQKNSEAVAPS